MSDMNLENLKALDLEERMKKSIFSRNYQVVDSYIVDNLRKGESNFFIPTIQTLTGRSPKLGQELINLYDTIFSECNTEDIDYEIKLLQASALDGLVVGVDMVKDGDFQIYTANIIDIFSIKNASKFNLEKTLELNRKRIVHAVRVDVEYTSEEGFDYKIVSLNKNTNLHIVDLDTLEGRFHLVPYIAIQRSMNLFSSLLEEGAVLEIGQDKGELYKSRIITCNENVLSRCSDNEGFAKSLKSSFFPLKGFFYAPVVGASSLSLGLTKIGLLDACKVTKVQSESITSKASGGIGGMITEASIITILNRLYGNDLSAYQEFVDKLPNDREILTGAVFDIDKGVPNPISIIKYMHGLSSDEMTLVESLVPGLDEEVAIKKRVISRYEELNIADYSTGELKEMLSKGVYKFHIRKKDCNFSSIVVTNCEDVLIKLYGTDYFARYESLGVRIRKFERLLERGLNGNKGDTIESYLKYCGLPLSKDIEIKIRDLVDARVGKVVFNEELLNLFGSKSKGTSRKSTRRSSENEDLILTRVCLASITSSGSSDFYRYLDISKVVSMYRLS